MSAGPHAGGTLNPDQWLAGGQALFDDLLVDALSAELALGATFGGNYAGLRAAPRIGYTLWLADSVPFGIGPVLGVATIYYVPVGPFASFCDRVDLDACRGFFVGPEVGGMIRYGWVRGTAAAGFGEIPAATFTVSLDIPLGGGTP